MKKFILLAVMVLAATAACNWARSATAKTNDSAEATAPKRATDNQTNSALGQKAANAPTENTQSSSLTGTYRYKKALYNNTRIINNAIGVEEKGNRLEISIVANYERKDSSGEWEVDTGTTGGVITLKGNTAVFVPENSTDCEFTLKFSGNQIIVKQKGQPLDCGLAGNTYADGVYTKTSNELNHNEMIDDEPQTANDGNSASDTQRIRFAAGASSATVSGKIVNKGNITYLVGARKGQTLEVKITDGGKNNDVGFYLIAPDGSFPMGEMDEGWDSIWRGKLKQTGDYKIVVGTMESENVNFKMFVAIR